MATDPEFPKSVADKVQETLAELRAERDARNDELESLNKEIAQWEQVLNSLAPMVEDIRLELKDSMFVEGVNDLTLTEAVQAVLISNPIYRTARGIRDSLDASGYDLSQHNNPLASIYGVLKRLMERDAVEELESNGKTRYRWKGLTAPTPREDSARRYRHPAYGVTIAEPPVTLKASERAIQRLRNVKLGTKKDEK